jgi:hypothetical protein
LTLLYWIGGVTLWLTIGAIVLGVDDAMTEPEKRILTGPNKSAHFEMIIFGVVIWPLILICAIAQLTAEYFARIRDKPDTSKPKDWDEELR